MITYCFVGDLSTEFIMEKKKRTKFIVGIDEVGRGPLAGPVAVSAVLMTKKGYKNLKSSKKLLSGLHNSKALSEKQREEWLQKIKEWKAVGLLDFSYATMSAEYIDEKGIAAAIGKCVARALNSLGVPDDTRILLDGSLYAPKKFKNQKTIIKGDEKEPIISFASIVAKVRRDNFMKKISLKYPQYKFDENKGYGTLAHRKAIKKYRLSEVHRKSFCRNIK